MSTKRATPYDAVTNDKGEVWTGGNARNQFWVGANHSAKLERVEPLD